MYKSFLKIRYLILLFCLGTLGFPIQAKKLSFFEKTVLVHSDNPNSQDSYLSQNTNHDNPFAPDDAKKDDAEEEKEEREETESEKNEKKRPNFYLFCGLASIHFRFNPTLEFFSFQYAPKFVSDPYHQSLYILYGNLRN